MSQALNIGAICYSESIYRSVAPIWNFDNSVKDIQKKLKGGGKCYFTKLASLQRASSLKSYMKWSTSTVSAGREGMYWSVGGWAATHELDFSFTYRIICILNYMSIGV